MLSHGTVVVWGEDDPAFDPPAGLAGVKSIRVGWNYIVAIKSNDTVVAWGYGGGMQAPLRLEGVTRVALGQHHILALVGTGDTMPFISIPPASQTAVVGANVVFQVRASGRYPLTYQ